MYQMLFTTFEEVISYMEKDLGNNQRPLGRNVRECRLERMKMILDRLDNPQICYNTLHVAGSKGKGSTSSYLASGIHALGLNTGLYLSPHVTDYRERFTVNGKFASDKDLIATGNILAEKLEGFSFDNSLGEESPTSFELYTAFAFLLFKQTKCEWAVIETGLGGRLDATNVIIPKASILTPIELEHTELLGDTIEKIAWEKSKIIKDNVPSFSSFQKPEAKKVFEQEAKNKNSHLTMLENVITSVTTKSFDGYQDLKVAFRDGFSAELKLKMIGDVQAYNCALALNVLRTLGLYKAEITEKALENNILPGRMEKLNWDRPLFIDGAHTENSMEHLISSFKSIFDDKKAVCIFGCLTGKNAEAMSKIILDNFKTVIICKPGTFKKSNPEELFNLVNSLKKDNEVLLIQDAKEALDYCLSHTEKDTPILVCGSFYLAGAVKEALCH